MDYVESSRTFAEMSRKNRVRLDVPACQSKCFEITEEDYDAVASKLYFNHKDKFFIVIEVGKTIIYLDRTNHPNTSYFDIWGRKYRTAKDSVFLNRPVSLGRINTEQWGESEIFFSLFPSLLKNWIELVMKDSAVSPNYQW